MRCYVKASGMLRLSRIGALTQAFEGGGSSLTTRPSELYL